MKKTLKIMLCITTLSYSFSSLASTPEMILTDPKTFKAAQRKGVFKKMRKYYAETRCPYIVTDEQPKINCDCFTQKLETISDKALLEASLTEYHMLLKRAAVSEAQQAGEMARAEEIQKTISTEKNALEVIAEQCSFS